MKILLIYISGVPDRSDPYINLLPTGICSLQAVLRQSSFDAIVANFSGYSEDAIKQHLSELQPDVVGISQWTHNRHAALALARLVRVAVPFSLVIFGGVHASFCYADLLDHGSPVDCVVIGEGEETLLELVRRLQAGDDWNDVQGIAYRCAGQINVTAPRPYLPDLDRLPVSVSYLEHSIGVDTQLQAEFIITTRGCPSACHFCSSPQFWERKVRYRSPENIVHEIEYIRERFGLIYFSIRDDTFTVDRSRTIEFCRLLIDRQLHILWNCQSRVTTLDEELLVWMKRAGCECIQLGVESGSPRILSELGKAINPAQVEKAAAMIRKTGINLSIYLISDVPGETEEDIKHTIDLVRRITPDDGYVSPLAYFPGTRMYNDAVERGNVEKNVFIKDGDSAIYATAGRSGAADRLLKIIGRHAQRGADRFREQKRLLGFCSVTNVLAGEYYRQNGDYAAAERELREVVQQEPENPWGWYLLGELYREIGRSKKAEECYEAVIKINPKHRPSRDALKAIKKRG